ncbi:molybdenum cofactor guanylyltransferase [Pseudanabaena biceps]|nr:molybdenum cofactor guanylyltransferase [Pseudanabaena biceps]
MKIITIALAGGKSLRMGSDKTLLELKGETLLWRTCRNAAIVSEYVYVVLHSEAQYQQAIAKISKQKFGDYLNRISVVVDVVRDGALMGFCQGIQAIAVDLDRDLPDWILLLACDLPNLQSDILQSWINQLVYLPESAIAYLPVHDRDLSRSSNNVDIHKQKQWEPLCGFYRWKCCGSLMEFMTNGGRSFQHWLSTQHVVEIPNVASDMLFNCNTPHDFLNI